MARNFDGKINKDTLIYQPEVFRVNHGIDNLLHRGPPFEKQLDPRPNEIFDVPRINSIVNSLLIDKG